MDGIKGIKEHSQRDYGTVFSW